MITASIMKPLPVRPVDGTPHLGAAQPQQGVRPVGTMQPLPFPDADGRDLAAALRTVALERMLNR